MLVAAIQIWQPQSKKRGREEQTARRDQCKSVFPTLEISPNTTVPTADAIARCCSRSRLRWCEQGREKRRQVHGKEGKRPEKR